MPGQRISPVIARNIHFVNGDNDEIAGTWQNGSLTWSEMSEWMQIVFRLPLDQYAPFPCLENGDPQDPLAQHGTLIDVHTNTNTIVPGFYVLLQRDGSPIDIPINEEMPTPRTQSRSLTESDPRIPDFRNRVRARDGRCVITDSRPHNGRFAHLHATHIFPLAHLDLVGDWGQSMSQHITDPYYQGSSGIHSVQNGILLRTDVHALFDQYDIAINPDNGYKTTCFVDDKSLDGLVMFQNENVPEHDQPSRELLKWHFRMAVLANMKARTGYPKWDEDVPPGYSCMAEMAKSDQGQLWFETALAEKLNFLIA